MKHIIRIINKKEFFLLGICAFLIACQVVLEIHIPNNMGEITELIYSGTSSFDEELVIGRNMLGFALMSFLCAFIVSFIVSKVGARIDCLLRKKVFEKITSFSLQEVGEFGTSSLIARCTTDIMQVQAFFVNGFQIFVKSIFMIFWITVQISIGHIYWRVATVISVVLLAIFLTAIVMSILPAVKKIQKTGDELIRVSSEHISGLRNVHAYNAYSLQRTRLQDKNDKMTSLELSYDMSMALFSPIANVIMYMLMISIYIIGAYLISQADSELSIVLDSQMIVFISYASILISSFIYLIMVMALLPNAWVSLMRIAQVLDKPLSISDPESTDSLEGRGVKGSIEFKNVSFKYPGSCEYALRDISFSIKQGDIVAIIGATGSGKTTLLNLIPRFYDVTEGEIDVNGVDIRKSSLRELRNIIGYVPQKSFLFTGTIFENLSYGDNGSMKKMLSEIKKAAQIGQADEFISMKENGYDSRVEEGGSNFSGGQKQRLTITRAIARDPEIFLFDDSFSALDNKTDKLLRSELKEAAGDSTMLIVAQKISTVRSADMILVMDEGRLVGVGTHDELMESCEVYKDIVSSQTDSEVAS